MTEPVAWTMLDTHTPVDPLGRYTTRDEALKALRTWEVYAAGRTHGVGRYIVCALVPDGLTTDEIMATAKEHLSRPPVLRDDPRGQESNDGHVRGADGWWGGS